MLNLDFDFGDDNVNSYAREIHVDINYIYY